MDKYVLAMYDVRGKQDLIFKTGKIKEIVGASQIIRDVFKDYLYPAAESVASAGKGIGIFHDPEPFDHNRFIQRVDKEGYIGEVVYDGGGNYLVLFKNEDLFREVTYRFTKEVKAEIGSLRILGVCVPIEDFSDFKADRKRLYAKHAVKEASESNIEFWPSLPIVQVDRRTSLPLTREWEDSWGEPLDSGRKVSKETAAKYEKWSKLDKNEFGEKILDKIVTEKGEESLLAVVYIDGNNMGAKVQTCLGEEDRSYDDCVRKLREFSADINRKFVEEPKSAIEDVLNAKYPDEKMRRFVVFAGDEINFICNAHDAFALVETYIDTLNTMSISGKEYLCSVCAGIAIFHSHAPYSDAYRIAEECCESGKRYMRSNTIEDASFLDFHYCQGAIGNSLDVIREEETGDFISRPWLMKGSIPSEKSKAKPVQKTEVEKMKTFLNDLGHSNVKGLLEPAKTGQGEFSMELDRIRAHMDKNKGDRAFKEVYDSIHINDKEKTKRALVYDMVSVYDLWFKSTEEGVK